MNRIVFLGEASLSKFTITQNTKRLKRKQHCHLFRNRKITKETKGGQRAASNREVVGTQGNTFTSHINTTNERPGGGALESSRTFQQFLQAFLP